MVWALDQMKSEDPAKSSICGAGARAPHQNGVAVSFYTLGYLREGGFRQAGSETINHVIIISIIIIIVVAAANLFTFAPVMSS